MSQPKKIIVLADILELGDFSKEIHESIGNYINEKDAYDYLITYGSAAKHINENARIPKVHVESIEGIAQQLEPYLDKDTVVLLKGSRGMEVERVIHYLS